MENYTDKQIAAAHLAAYNAGALPGSAVVIDLKHLRDLMETGAVRYIVDSLFIKVSTGRKVWIHSVESGAESLENL